MAIDKKIESPSNAAFFWMLTLRIDQTVKFDRAEQFLLALSVYQNAVRSTNCIEFLIFDEGKMTVKCVYDPQYLKEFYIYTKPSNNAKPKK